MISLGLVEEEADRSRGMKSLFGPVHGMSVAIVDPDAERGRTVSGIVCTLRPSGLTPRITRLTDFANPQALKNQGAEVVLIAVDRNRESALETINALGHSGATTVMAYAESADDDLLLRCVQAGVREFLHYPFAPGVVEEAFHRRATRGQLTPDTKEVIGKSFVFFGAKGGAGVTTAACNFAASLAQESKQNTLLIDLDLPFGDAALCLGINSRFSTLDALNEANRLDSSFLARLLSKHESGLYVLGAPGTYRRIPPPTGSVDQLLAVASKSFDYVVVDAGSRLELMDTRLFDLVSTIFLVTQVGVAELRNSNRLITECLPAYSSKVEVVLNRYTAEMFGIDDRAIESALTRPAHWRIPNDFAAVRRMHHTAEPLRESTVLRAIKKMAAAASDQGGEHQDRKKRTGLFGFLRA